jgi:hypothetical protein
MKTLETAMKPLEHPIFKESEAYHAKSVHIAAKFLPKDCPLVDYVINSYQKNYLRDR